MPTQPTLRRPRSLSNGRARRLAHRVNCVTVGQYFDVEVTRDTDGWLIRIPEVGGVTRALRRAEVDLAARECIATRTGIPIGYVAVHVASEIV